MAKADKSPQVHNTELDDHTEIEVRLSLLEDKLEKENKSLIKRTGIIGGLVALALSLVTGGFTIYEKLYLNPNEKNEDLVNEVRGVLSRVTEINWKILDFQITDNKLAAQLAAKTANAEKASLIYKADSIIQKLDMPFSSLEYLSLAHEYFNFGDYEKVLDYTNKAIGVIEEENGGIWLAEALRFQGRVLYASSAHRDLEQGNDSFVNAISTVKKLDSFQSDQVLSNIYLEWISAEALFGSCEKAQSIIRTSLEELSTAAIELSYEEALRNSLSYQVRCSLSV